MSDQELRIRARRLFAGDVRLEDIDRLFLDQRQRCCGRKHFQEMGDFLAHRSERNRGPVTDVMRDIMTSFRVWSMPMRGKQHTLRDISEAGEANLRLMTDAQLLAGCGLKRQSAGTKFHRGIAKLEAGDRLSDKEVKAVNYIGNNFVWRPAFTDKDLAGEFFYVLSRNGIIPDPPAEMPPSVCTALALHALSRMHETVISHQGIEAQLFAGTANSLGVLEVKLNMNTLEWPKPVVAPVCLFMTSLQSAEHCDVSLPVSQSGLDWDSWRFPIELGRDGKLCRLA
jgi:hypothetical protein